MQCNAWAESLQDQHSPGGKDLLSRWSRHVLSVRRCLKCRIHDEVLALYASLVSSILVFRCLQACRICRSSSLAKCW